MTVKIINADVMAGLAQVPDESVQCVVTSPPYWSMRDYGADGQIGLEPTLDSHIEKLVAVFREVRRVMRKDGTLWLNYGDFYASAPNGRKAANIVNDDRGFVDKPVNNIHAHFKPKDLIPASWMLAIALQKDGWWLRRDIIWEKTNPMPESAKDRPATAHEYIFLLTKSERYFYDWQAVREPAVEPHAKREGFRKGSHTNNSSFYNSGRNSFCREDSKRSIPQIGQAQGTHRPDRKSGYLGDGKRNMRSVWKFCTTSLPIAHFATFPPELVERCLKAGTKEGSMVLDPFGGAGTTGLVAGRLGRSCTLIELNPAYCDIARRRIDSDAPLLNQPVA